MDHIDITPSNFSTVWNELYWNISLRSPLFATFSEIKLQKSPLRMSFRRPKTLPINVSTKGTMIELGDLFVADIFLEPPCLSQINKAISAAVCALRELHAAGFAFRDFAPSNMDISQGRLANFANLLPARGKADKDANILDLIDISRAALIPCVLNPTETEDIKAGSWLDMVKGQKRIDVLSSRLAKMVDKRTYGLFGKLSKLVEALQYRGDVSLDDISDTLKSHSCNLDLGDNVRAWSHILSQLDHKTLPNDTLLSEYVVHMASTMNWLPEHAYANIMMESVCEQSRLPACYYDKAKDLRDLYPQNSDWVEFVLADRSKKMSPLAKYLRSQLKALTELGGDDMDIIDEMLAFLQ